MGESALLEALITAFIGLIVTAATAGGVAAYTFRSLSKTAGDLADRLSKTIDERDEASKAKNAEMGERALLNIKLSEAIHDQSVLRNELAVVAGNASKMDEAVRQMGIRLTAVENEKKVVELERDQLKAENEQLKIKNAELEAERDELTKQLKNLQAQIDQLRIEVHNLQTQKALEDVPPKPSESPENINPALVLTAPPEAIVRVKPEGENPL